MHLQDDLAMAQWMHDFERCSELTSRINRLCEQHPRASTAWRVMAGRKHLYEQSYWR